MFLVTFCVQMNSWRTSICLCVQTNARCTSRCWSGRRCFLLDAQEIISNFFKRSVCFDGLRTWGNAGPFSVINGKTTAEKSQILLRSFKSTVNRAIGSSVPSHLPGRWICRPPTAARVKEPNPFQLMPKRPNCSSRKSKEVIFYAKAQ